MKKFQPIRIGDIIMISFFGEEFKHYEVIGKVIKSTPTIIAIQANGFYFQFAKTSPFVNVIGIIA
jgi:hypothetical protein